MVGDEGSAFAGEDRYKVLVDAITDYAIYMLDPQGNIVSWNAGASRFKGYEAGEVLGTHFSRFYRATDRDKGLPLFALTHAAEKGRFEDEGWRVRKDGSEFWAHVIIDPIRDNAGSLVGFAKITRDLTERRQAEEHLRRTEQQFRLLVQGVTDYAIYMMDADGRVSSWNAGAERIKGYRPGEIIGRHFSHFFPEQDRLSGIPDHALDIARNEGRYESEGWRLRKDGTRFWANAIIDAIRDDDGALIGFAKITRDITEKRDAQAALELAREELFQAQKMEALGQLTGGVAHDFNNLLMAVQASLDLLKRRISPAPEAQSLIDNALQATRRGASLVQRLLAFSRRQELDFESVDLWSLIRGMTDMLQRSIGPSVMIETHFPPNLPPVRTDPNQMVNALLNLAINARDAMPDGGRLFIGARLEADGTKSHPDLQKGAYLCLYMQDEGQGMDPDTLRNAASPFFTTKGVGKGTGLGLSMVQGLMAQSEGKLVLQSKSGAGTTAELWLPVAEAGATAIELARKEVPTAPPVPKEIHPLCVIAVDDDPLVLMNTVMMLEDMGHIVCEASSGTKALAFLAERTIDLIVTDQAMPQMTGSQLADIVRERWPDIPIVIATGYSELPPEARADLLRLSKPFSERQLEDIIRRAVSGDRQQPSPS
ncbi:PAS domain-containing sensor histidine kinase [Sinorhizobium sp. RAC02]|uniref:hybrid sensor histidine kinase/response regulator n=1 Tax=Sinorhizobium sp. RAC02 TaxID=1842534 RepID=UPI00083CC3C6|nr:PAS domain-containing sensor histidine kinase [Sinorhizobium sp. RAC02]AOF94471.1 sensory box protein [Sinorhizobium sp. RAC02]